MIFRWALSEKMQVAMHPYNYGFRVLAKDKIYTRASYSHGIFPLTNALRLTATALPIFSREVLPFSQYHSFHENFPITVVLPVCVNSLLSYDNQDAWFFCDSCVKKEVVSAELVLMCFRLSSFSSSFLHPLHSFGNKDILNSDMT